MNRETVISALDTLDEEFDTERLIEKLLFIEKLEKGQKDLEEGRTMTLEQARQRFEDKWAK